MPSRPALDASKIDVSLDRGVLRIAGERASDVPSDDPKVYVYTRERAAGSFTRAISLPDDVDPAQLNASYRDGVLVTVLKSDVGALLIAERDTKYHDSVR